MSGTLYSLKSCFEVGAPDNVLTKINKALVLIGLKGVFDRASKSQIEYTVSDEAIERLDIVPDNGLYVSLRRLDDETGKVVYLLADDYKNGIPVELDKDDAYSRKVYDVISSARDLLTDHTALQTAPV